MAELKNFNADLKAKYKKVIEISTILSLVILIVAFKFFPNLDSNEAFADGTQELFTVEDIIQTKQENLPPPPPKPPILIEAPTDNVLDDIDIASSEIDFNTVIEAPPPLRDEKIVEEEEQYFVVVEEMPEPIGGIAAIQSKIVYTEIAKRVGVEGRVHVYAFVDENGNVTKVELIKGLGAGLDEAAMNAIKQTKFKPGKQRGKNVKVQIAIPIVFRLQ